MKMPCIIAPPMKCSNVSLYFKFIKKPSILQCRRGKEYS